jgi:predicted transcriptional regulator
MKSHYEGIIKRLMPAVRAGVAKEFSGRYHMTQTEISKKLGVTQAEISKYLKGMYSDSLKKVEAAIPKSAIQEIAKDIAENKDREAQKEMCKICEKTFGFSCSLMIK